MTPLDTNRLIRATSQEEDAPDKSLRPRSLREFIGQKPIRENLSVYIEAAKSRGESLDHSTLR